jgi:hypothetical protein
MLISFILTIVLFATIGATMSRYDEGLLTTNVTLKDLMHKILSNSKKVVLVMLAVFLLSIALSITAIILFAIFPVFLKVIFGILLFFGIMAVIPTLFLILYPALFQDVPTWKSIIKGVTLGFKNWGSTFVIIMIIGIATTVISMIFQMPYSIWLALNPLKSGIVSYLLITLSTLGSVIIMPVSFIFLAFQYFAITEKEEGISLQSKINEFDNL